MDSFIEAVHLSKTFRIGKHSVPVLRGVDLNVARGEWIALLGASGSGKTTLLDIIGTISRPDGGELLIEGEDTSRLSGNRLVAFRRRKIGFVFQSFHLLPELTILENVMLPAMLNGTGRKEAFRRAGELLEHVGLSDRLRHRPNELSGGEQQRTAIARCLVNSPELILADEPTGNLDSVNGKAILSIFRSIHADRNRTIIMVTHDASVAAEADRRVILKDGVTVPE